MKTDREKKLEIALLKEKLERISGKKILFKEIETVKMSYKDPDIQLLVKNLTSSGFRLDPALRVSAFPEIEGNYLRVLSYLDEDLRFWTEEEKNIVREVFKKTNKNTVNVNFILKYFTDWEEEPRERTWDASISFYSEKK